MVINCGLIYVTHNRGGWSGKLHVLRRLAECTGEAHTRGGLDRIRINRTDTDWPDVEGLN